MRVRDLQDRIVRRAQNADLAVQDSLAERLAEYFDLLTKWNQRINLTAFDTAEQAPEAIDRLLIEPLVAARYIPQKAARMIDVGSGGGSPAIPVALSRPQLQVLMVESKTRKAVFLREAVRALQLHAEVASVRIEELASDPNLHDAYDIATIRAVRLEAQLFKAVQTLLKPGGQLFLFRGLSRGESGDPMASLPPCLLHATTHTLLDSLHSRLMVFEKRRQPADVPRGTE